MTGEQGWGPMSGETGYSGSGVLSNSESAGHSGSHAWSGDAGRWLSEAKEKLSLGDFSGSLELMEKILELDPDHREAREYLIQNEAALVSMYESKLGPMDRVPRLAIKPEEVVWLGLDHRAGFLLSQIDGVVTLESLFALSGMTRLDTARILAGLLRAGVITSWRGPGVDP